MSLCIGCKQKRELVYVDSDTGIGYCESCVEFRPLAPEEQGLLFLLSSIPFEVGDVVECRTGSILYDGVGVVEEVSFDLVNGGTPSNPSFRVRFTEKSDSKVPDEFWYTEVCLKDVEHV